MYLALYRKYRPDNFEDLIGQEHITRSLINQIKNNQVAHAYLFCGSRGTGKTTAAKVFARAINCEKPLAGSPCNKCAACKALSDPSNMDVIEIDAASNNKVDEVREIRERAKYPPVSCKYKVYIIDEVHMLTESAFNALLKTLEEPPKHVVFILATTEAHKLPATILSRVLRFDFKLLSKTNLEKLLKKVFKQAGIICDDTGLSAIASAGEGSVRDALSVADMCAAYSNNNINYADVLSVLGSSDRQTVVRLAHAVLESDIATFLKEINKFSESGKNLGALAKDLTSHIRDIILIKTLPDANKMLGLPQEVFKAISIDANFTIARLNTCMQAFSKAGLDLKFSTDPLLTITAAAVELMAESEAGDASKKKLNITPTATNISSGGDRTGLKAESDAGMGNIKKDESSTGTNASVKTNVNMGAKPTAEQARVARKVWGKVLVELDKRKLMLLYPICGKITDVSLAGDVFRIVTASVQEQKLLKKEQNMADLLATFALLGYNYKVVIDCIPETNTQQKSTEEKLKEKFGSILKVN